MKRMIDAEALISQMKASFKKVDGEEYGFCLHVTKLINQLSITFDDDGWCWDMGKAPKDEEFDVLCLDTSRNKNYRFPDCYWDEEENKIVNEYYNYFNDYRYKMIAWRLLPNIPEVKPQGGKL